MPSPVLSTYVHYHLYSANGDSEAQRGQGIYQKSHSQQLAQLRLEAVSFLLQTMCLH